MTRFAWLMVMVAACGGGKEPADDDTPTTDDTDVGGDDTDMGGDDTDVGGDDTDVGGDDTDAVDTDTTDTDAGDTDLPGDTTAPVITIPSASDYTFYYDSIALNIYWRDAADDVTPAAALEYRVTCRPVGGSAGVTMDWAAADTLVTEGSGRYWFPACSGALGFYDVWVSVRDEAGNMDDYPVLTGEIYLPPT